MNRNAARTPGRPPRDRRPFTRPAIAATALSPFFWPLLLGTDPKRGFAGFGGVEAVLGFGTILPVAALLPALGWLFASRSVFAVLALGGIVAWVPWAYFVAFVLGSATAAWPDLSAADRATGVVLSVQLLLWPLCFALVFRLAVGGPETPWRARLAAWLDALRPRNLLARDRRGYATAALAGALCNPLPWALQVLDKRRGPFTALPAGWDPLSDFALLLLVGAVPALLGWLLASWAVFGVLAWCSILAWGAWVILMMEVPGFLTNALPTLDPVGRLVSGIIVAQVAAYPLGFWLVLRRAMGWDRPGAAPAPCHKPRLTPSAAAARPSATPPAAARDSH